MAKEKIEVLVEGGKATAAPPLGPALGPLKVNITAVVDAINEKTKGLAGMQVPVKVMVDTVTHAYEIEVGTPPASALIRKELGLQIGSHEAGKTIIGRVNTKQVESISQAKFGSTDKRYTQQIKGTARSMGIVFGDGEITEEEKKAFDEARKKQVVKKEALPKEGEAAPEEAGEEEEPKAKEGKEAKPKEGSPKEAKPREQKAKG